MRTGLPGSLRKEPFSPDFMSEHINHEAGQPDEWVCLCRNRSDSDGFFPCLPDGREVEPAAAGPWNGESYVCARCGRVINQFTREVTGQASPEIRALNVVGNIQ